MCLVSCYFTHTHTFLSLQCFNIKHSLTCMLTKHTLTTQSPTHSHTHFTHTHYWRSRIHSLHTHTHSHSHFICTHYSHKHLIHSLYTFIRNVLSRYLTTHAFTAHSRTTSTQYSLTQYTRTLHSFKYSLLCTHNTCAIILHSLHTPILMCSRNHSLHNTHSLKHSITTSTTTTSIKTLVHNSDAIGLSSFLDFSKKIFYQGRTPFWSNYKPNRSLSGV